MGYLGYGQGGAVIGSPVPGGTAGTVLYLDSSGNLANEAAFAYAASTNTLTAGRYVISTAYVGGQVQINAPADATTGIAFNSSATYFTLTGTISVALNHSAVGCVHMASTGYLGWSPDGTAITANDVQLHRDAAAVLAIRNGTTAQEARVYGRYVSATNRNYLTIKHSIATVTASAGATVVATNVIPAKVIIIGVGTTVTTALGTGSGTTGYNVGDGSDADRWGAIVGTAIGTDSDYSDYTAAPIPAWNAAAQSITLTATGGNFDGTGVISVDVAYIVVESD